MKVLYLSLSFKLALIIIHLGYLEVSLKGAKVWENTAFSLQAMIGFAPFLCVCSAAPPPIFWVMCSCISVCWCELGISATHCKCHAVSQIHSLWCSLVYYSFIAILFWSILTVKGYLLSILGSCNVLFLLQNRIESSLWEKCVFDK